MNKAEKLIKEKLIKRGFTEEHLLNNRGLIGAVIEECFANSEQPDLSEIENIIISIADDYAVNERTKHLTLPAYINGLRDMYLWLRENHYLNKPYLKSEVVDCKDMLLKYSSSVENQHAVSGEWEDEYAVDKFLFTLHPDEVKAIYDEDDRLNTQPKKKG